MMQNIVMNVAVMEMITILMKKESGFVDVLNVYFLLTKMMMIEANAEEIKANRSIFDGVAEALNNFSYNLFGANTNIQAEDVASALSNYNEQEEDNE